MAFEVGYEVAPEYRRISHDPNEEKCRVRVTLASDREDLPSIKFEAGGRSLSHPENSKIYKLLFKWNF